MEAEDDDNANDPCYKMRVNIVGFHQRRYLTIQLVGRESDDMYNPDCRANFYSFSPFKVEGERKVE